MYLKDKNKVIHIRVSEEEFKKLSNIAELNNLNISDVIRKALIINNRTSYSIIH